MSNHFYDLFTPSSRDASRQFLRLVDGATVSYGDLEAISGRMANVLVAHGVKPGDRVAVQAEKSPNYVFLYVACLRAGAVFLPLNTAYTAAEIGYFLGDAEPALFVCDPKAVDAAGGVPTLTMDRGGQGSLADAADSSDARFKTVDRGPDDLAAILYTSGTTGKSKGAMLTHDNLASNAQVLVDYWRFSRDDVLIHALPIFHAHGLFVAINVTLVAGSTMVFLPKFDPAQVLQLLQTASVFMGVPTLYTRLLQQEGLTRDAAQGMRLFVSGSAPLLAETHREWQARTGHAILERYGMTETLMNTSNPYDGDRIPGTVGFPLPGIEVQVRSLEGDGAVPAGEPGMLEVRGPNVFKGYWRMPEKTAAELRPDGFFITGDVGTIDERGYIRIVGRTKDLIISGGYNVYPKEIEEEIDAIEGVVESAVFGLPHPDFGEGTTAAVVLRPGVTLSQQQVISNLETKLARYKLPKTVVFLDDLPRNVMGKVQKNLLRDQFADLYAPKAS